MCTIWHYCGIELDVKFLILEYVTCISCKNIVKYDSRKYEPNCWRSLEGAGQRWPVPDVATVVQ